MAKKRDVERNFEVHTNPHPDPLVRDIPNVLRRATPEELEERERNVRALVALQKWDGKRFWKNRRIVFALEDVEAFTELLKASFPRIRFLDEKALGARKHEAFGSVHIARCEPKLRYFDSLADPDQKWFLCWLEPEGWKPKIGPTRFAPNARCILNEPPLQFEFRGMRAVLYMNYSTGQAFRRKDKPLPPCWVRPDGELLAHPRVGDTEHKAFLGKVYNLVTKIATNKLVCVDTLTGRALVPPKLRGEKVWVGHHALAWCREHPRHFLAGYFRPADEAEWRSRLPTELPDYLSEEEAHERFVARVRFEQQARRKRQLAEGNGIVSSGNSKKEPGAKSPSKQTRPKKKGG